MDTQLAYRLFLCSTLQCKRTKIIANTFLLRKGHQKISDSFKQIGQSVIDLDEAKKEMSSGKEVEEETKT